MKPQTAISVVPAVRCAYRSAGGRRCPLSVSDPRSVFCPQHRSEQLEEEAADHFSYLSHNFQCFQTAQGINHSLHNLYALLAQNRISPRRAAVLSHICGLLLRTLPQIDADKAAGIFDPTKPIEVSVADEDTGTDEDSDLDSDDNEESETESDTVTLTDTNVDPGSTNTWDASIPEPDPKKKPS